MFLLVNFTSDDIEGFQNNWGLIFPSKVQLWSLVVKNIFEKTTRNMEVSSLESLLFLVDIYIYKKILPFLSPGIDHIFNKIHGNIFMGCIRDNK
jgi:hypothetical protein